MRAATRRQWLKMVKNILPSPIPDSRRGAMQGTEDFGPSTTPSRRSDHRYNSKTPPVRTRQHRRAQAGMINFLFSLSSRSLFRFGFQRSYSFVRLLRTRASRRKINGRLRASCARRSFLAPRVFFVPMPAVLHTSCDEKPTNQKQTHTGCRP